MELNNQHDSSIEGIFMVWALNIFAVIFAVISVQLIFQILPGIVAMSYTFWKWRAEYLDKKNKTPKKK